ncbi:MAG: prepilin-type N-terminal cleavage/methylation domain-containing protein [Candidatus Kerfeldbacteria bacterium]|nr:prepilin-type N-terminal cleavage/methylation domain-containing protein [Candidatus Kerfeldbacteria bacterium]
MISINRRGFTLIEAVVAMLITALMILVGSDLLINGNRLANTISEQTDAITTARVALDPVGKIVRELRSGENGEYPIIVAEADSFIFYSDVDSDALTEQVEYTVVGTELRQRLIEPSGDPATYDPAATVETVIANGIVNTSLTAEPIFRYYTSDYPTDTTNNPLPTPADVTAITLVAIHLDININPNQLPETSAVETFIQLRNLKTNL